MTEASLYIIEYDETYMSQWLIVYAHSAAEALKTAIEGCGDTYGTLRDEGGDVKITRIDKDFGAQGQTPFILRSGGRAE
jgi:hypothetical protein